MRKRNMLVAGVSGVVLTAGSVAFGATALAAPSAPPVLKACVADKGGTMYQVSSSTTKCASGQHLITWNQAGVAGAAGAAGKNGTNGLNGTNGTNGVNGTKIVARSGKPNTADKAAAKTGDLFLDTTSGTLSVFSNGNYAATSSFKGPKGDKGDDGYDGKAGADGSQILAGEGEPTDEVALAAKEGDLYLDTTAGDLYRFDGDTFGAAVSLVGAKGDDGDKGADGSKIVTGAGAPSQEVQDAANAGDLYLNTTAGTLSAFDGTAFGTPVSLKGAKGDDGDKGADGSKIVTGAGAPSQEVQDAANAGDLYLNTTTGDLATFDGTEFVAKGSLKGAPGEKGTDGDSLSVERTANPEPVVVGSTVTFTCAEGQTAIGAGYGNVNGAQLTGSDAGQTANEWVLTFGTDPGSAPTGHALCAVVTPGA
jgi:hypothetical protein